MLGKYIMFGVSGSWGVTLAKDVFDRVAKNEDAVKKLSEAVNQMNVETAHSEEMFRKHKEEVDVKYEKLRHEVNELRCFKDLWMGSWVHQLSRVRCYSSPPWHARGFLSTLCGDMYVERISVGGCEYNSSVVCGATVPLPGTQ